MSTSVHTSRNPDAAATAERGAKRVLVLVGAGISTSAGLPVCELLSTVAFADLIKDYRSDRGLYKNSLIFSNRFFLDPSNYEEVIRTSRSLYEKARDCAPTKTHRYIARLKAQKRLVRCYTQNADQIEDKVGLTSDLSSTSVECVRLHGTFHRLRCRQCCFTCGWDTLPSLSFPEQLACPDCDSKSSLRKDGGYLRKKSPGQLLPDVALLDEPHRDADTIGQLVQLDVQGNPDLLLILGTSLRVNGPATLARKLAAVVHSNGGKVIYVNSERPRSHLMNFVDQWVGELCDEWVGQLDHRDRPSPDPPTHWSTPSEEGSQKDATEDGFADQGVKDTKCTPRSVSATANIDSPNQQQHRRGRKRTADYIIIDDDESPQRDPQQRRPLFHLRDEQLSGLGERCWVNDAVIFAFNRIVEYVAGSDLVKIIDPIGVRNKREGSIRATSAVVLLPILVNENHWVVARIRSHRKMIDVFDSLPSYGNRTVARSKAEAFYKREIDPSTSPSFSYSTPLRQDNSSDCGVAVMVTILYLSFGLQIEPGVDFAGCRRMLRDLLCDFTSQNDVPPVYETTTITLPEDLRSMAHRRSIPVADYRRILENMNALAQETAIRLAREEALRAKSVDWAHKARGLVQLLKQKSAHIEGAQAREVGDRLTRADEGLKKHIGSAQI